MDTSSPFDGIVYEQDIRFLIMIYMSNVKRQRSTALLVDCVEFVQSSMSDAGMKRPESELVKKNARVLFATRQVSCPPGSVNLVDSAKWKHLVKEF